jgi:CHAT domain-containing protein
LYEEEGLQVQRIPFSASEAQAIERYAGNGSRIYTGVEASENRIKNEQLDRFRVLHFATHGLISQRMPGRSALVLTPGDAEDGFLQVREIYHLKLQSDLVVLSACQTARGQVLGGDGVRGLAQAFLHAGARSVLASLWDVNDQRTALFMETFYRHLADQKSKAEALRATKLELVQNDATSAPRYWAAFILIGEADERVAIARPARIGGWLVVFAAGSLLVVAGIFLIQLRRMKRSRRVSASPQTSGVA